MPCTLADRHHAVWNHRDDSRPRHTLRLIKSLFYWHVEMSKVAFGHAHLRFKVLQTHWRVFGPVLKGSGGVDSKDPEL